MNNVSHTKNRRLIRREPRHKQSSIPDFGLNRLFQEVTVDNPVQNADYKNTFDLVIYVEDVQDTPRIPGIALLTGKSARGICRDLGGLDVELQSRKKQSSLFGPCRWLESRQPFALPFSHDSSQSNSL